LIGSLVLRHGRFEAGSPERRTLGWAAVILLVLMGGIGLSALYTGTNNDKWRQTWALAPKPNMNVGTAMREEMLAPAGQAGMPAPKMAARAMPADAAAGAEPFARGGFEKRMEPAMPRVMRQDPPPPAAMVARAVPAGPGGQAGDPNQKRFGAPEGEGGNRFAMANAKGDDKAKDMKKADRQMPANRGAKCQEGEAGSPRRRRKPANSG
jgi:hypothetical protein